MPLNPVIQLNKLTKAYKGRNALVNTTFTVYQGDLCGVAGIPGSGKTTLYNVLCGLTRDYAGMATIAGKNVTFDTLPIKRMTGFVPAEPSLPEELRAIDVVRFAANIRGYCDEARLAALFEQFSIVRKKPVRKMTISERKRLAIVCATFFSPQILIMDEPMLGLDNRMKDRLFDLLVKEKEKGTTILMTCSDYEEAGTICSSVVVLHKGSVVNNSQKEQLAKLNTRHISILSDDNLEPVMRYFRLNPIIDPNGYISFLYKGEMNPLIMALSHYKIKDLSITYPSMGETVATLYKEQEEEMLQKPLQTPSPIYEAADDNGRDLYSSREMQTMRFPIPQPAENISEAENALSEPAAENTAHIIKSNSADSIPIEKAVAAQAEMKSEPLSEALNLDSDYNGKNGDEINE